jgi:hypothetical protein
MDLASCDLKLSALREPLCVLRTNHRFEFQKRRQLFIRVDDETFSVAAWRCISLSGFTPLISSALS